MKQKENIVMMTNAECRTFRNRHHFITAVSELAEELGMDDRLISRLSRRAEKHYRSYYIKSKSGKFRKIEEPDIYMSEVQYGILKCFLNRYPVSAYATAYRKGSRITDNARPHVGKNYVLKMDLSDFFGHITDEMVYKKVFRKAPFSRDVAVMLTKLCTLKGSLPQGASTSPAISNLVMADFDEYMGAWCNVRGISYTRYSDDLTFSSFGSLVPVYLKAKNRLEKIGFRINEEKTRLIRSHKRQQVTGIVVNEKINISSDYRRKLRQEIHYVLRYGAEDAYEKVRKKADVTSQTVRQYVLSLLGKTDYVLQIRKDDGFFWKAKRDLRAEISRLDTNSQVQDNTVPADTSDMPFC